MGTIMRGGTGSSSIGISDNYTGTGEGMIYSNNGGFGTWFSIPSMPLAMYVEGVSYSTATLYVDFATYDLYQWNSTTWIQLTNSHPASMVGEP
jgi:hypothetical protein